MKKRTDKFEFVGVFLRKFSPAFFKRRRVWAEPTFPAFFLPSFFLRLWCQEKADKKFDVLSVGSYAWHCPHEKWVRGNQHTSLRNRTSNRQTLFFATSGTKMCWTYTIANLNIPCSAPQRLRLCRNYTLSRVKRNANMRGVAPQPHGFLKKAGKNFWEKHGEISR